MVAIAERYQLLVGRVDERLLRQLAGAEAKVLGRGGVSAVSRATGLAINTVRRGLAELDDPASALDGRIRKTGGGRKRLRDKNPELTAALEKLVEPFSRGDPMRPLRWTCKSVRRLAAELLAAGHRISPSKVAELLAELGYSLQSHRKRDEGSSHEDRDAQFRHINDQVEAFQRGEQPVISVDTKKKELVGAYKNGGQEWRPKGRPEEVKVYDFIDKELGKAIPYGVYDLQRNEGWVSVGCDHDTSEFAVETIRRWWRKMGRERYPRATRLLITADGGGSNSVRCHLWKWCLAQLSRELGLEISVSFSPSHQQMEQNRASAFLPHHAELARQGAGQSRSGRGTHRRHYYAHWTESEGRARRIHLRDGQKTRCRPNGIHQSHPRCLPR